MHVLFLDFDGPVFPDRIINFHPDNRIDHPELIKLRKKMVSLGDTFAAKITTYWKMDEVAVNMLNTLMKEKPFWTVVSSSWRQMCSKETIEYIFAVNGLHLKLHPAWLTNFGASGSCSSSSGDRADQIRDWITDHFNEFDDYAILDDPESGGSLNDRDCTIAARLDPDSVILVDPKIGLEVQHYDRLLNLLS